VSVYFGYAHEGKKRKLPWAPTTSKACVGSRSRQVSGEIRRISRVYQSGITDLHAHFERERETTEARSAGRGRGRPAGRWRAQPGHCVSSSPARVSYLKRKGKATDTAKDEESMFRQHVPEGALKIASD